MADTPEINPDHPPAEPFEVAVSPDHPPTPPFDVPTFPDHPPAGTFDVPVYPDGPPGAPFDVAINPDRPPRTPLDVPISPDAPPADPIQVDIRADRPPRAPFDVAISPDTPPADPFDVATRADSPPADPIAIEVRPDGPPRPPVDVSVVPVRPPAAPFSVAVNPDRPPVAPFQVPIYPDLPAVQIPGRPGDTPTVEQIVQAVGRFDSALGSFLGTLVEVDPVTATGPGGGALNPVALARWFKDYTSSVGRAGVARFIAEQSALYGMNPVVARIFDPTYFLKLLVPGAAGHVRGAADTELGVTMQTVALARDAALEAAVAANPLRPGGNGLSDRPDAYGPENTLRDGQAFTVDSMVDAAVPGLTENPGGGEFLKRDGGVLRFDATSYFESRGSDGSQSVRALVKARAASGLTNAFSSRLAASNALDGVVRVTVPGEELDGSVLSTTEDPSDTVDDDDARVPISFTDLRKDPVRNAYRSVYFRPLNLQFNTTFTPEWAEGSTFGRVDPVVGYQKTTRTVNLQFEVHAFAPEDVRAMYNKMTWLASMCYPSYGEDGLMRSGPVTRLRIGDAVSTESGGLPGVIRTLGFDFSEALWELKRGMKVPRSFKVSVDFLALHEGPVGLLNGVFGVLQLPPGGPAPDRDTNLAGGPTDSRANGTPDGVSLLPGRFSKFGEPRR